MPVKKEKGWLRACLTPRKEKKEEMLFVLQYFTKSRTYTSKPEEGKPHLVWLGEIKKREEASWGSDFRDGSDS